MSERRLSTSARDLEWTGGITSSRPARPGQLVRGVTVERTARFLGREFVYGYFVTEHEPDRLAEMKVDRPFPKTVRYELADAPGRHARRDPGEWVTRQVLRLGDAADGPPGAAEHHRGPGAAPNLPGTLIPRSVSNPSLTSATQMTPSAGSPTWVSAARSVWLTRSMKLIVGANTGNGCRAMGGLVARRGGRRDSHGNLAGDRVLVRTRLEAYLAAAPSVRAVVQP
ncbi:MAG TPA: hypothetical protein VF821_04055 [Lentzea sp.]